MPPSSLSSPPSLSAEVIRFYRVLESEDPALLGLLLHHARIRQPHRPVRPMRSIMSDLNRCTEV